MRLPSAALTLLWVWTHVTLAAVVSGQCDYQTLFTVTSSMAGLIVPSNRRDGAQKIYNLLSDFLDFPSGLDSKASVYNAGDLGLIPGLGRSPGERKGYPLQYSALENSMDCIEHGVAKSWTQLSDFHHHSQSKELIIF